MTIEFMDNFSAYGVNGQFRMANGLYANVGDGASIQNDPSGASGLAYRAGGGGTGERGYRRVLGGARSRVGMAARVWFTQLPITSFGTIFSFRNISNDTLCELICLTTGALRFTSSSASITTAGPVIIPNGFQHVEILVDFSTTVGAVEVRVEGVTVLTGTNLNTGGATCSQVVGCYTGNTVPWFQFHKDLIIYNGLGSANNSFLGACIVASLDPASDVTLNWTPSTGANGFSILDNRPPNDGQYIEAGDPPPGAYEATLTDLPPDVTSVRALQTMVRAAKVDGGDGNLQVSLVSGVDVANGADRPITSAFTYWTDIFETDPATTAPWTPTAVDAVQMRLNRTV